LIVTPRMKLSRRCGPSLPTTFSPGATPAQHTRPCRPPKPFTAASTAACVDTSSVTSVRTKQAAAPSSAASALPASSLRSAITTLPPPSTTMRAVAAPRPEAPPVTRNTEFAIFIACAPCVSDAFDDGGGGHAVADAHDLQAEAAVALLETGEHLGHQAGTGAAQRVAVGDRAAPGVEAVHVGRELAHEA